jgi:hypothetical protein
MMSRVEKKREVGVLRERPMVVSPVRVCIYIYICNGMSEKEE